MAQETMAKTTLPALLLKNARERSDQPAMRKKHLGIWRTHTWADNAENVRGSFLLTTYALRMSEEGERKAHKPVA